MSDRSSLLLGESQGLLFAAHVLGELAKTADRNELQLCNAALRIIGDRCRDIQEEFAAYKEFA